VFQRQLAKQGLSEALVDDAGGDNRHFNRDDLRDLFRVGARRCFAPLRQGAAAGLARCCCLRLAASP
jgi:hypothetical protein